VRIIVLLSVSAVLLFIVGWIGVRGLVAKGELEAAIPLATTIKKSLLSNEPERAATQLATLQSHTATAVSLTGDVIWRAVELLPVVGSNLTAFREAAEVIDTVSSEALSPVVELAGTIDVSSFKPIDGQINLDPILDAQDNVALADDVVRDALDKTRDIDTSYTLAPVTAAIKQLDKVLADASSTLSSVRTTVNLLPGMLGVDGPRNYLLIFQNNAETRTLGGNPASLALLHVDDGRIDLTSQASSKELRTGVPALDLDPALLELYGNNLAPTAITGYVQNITMIPDFATTATLAKAMWERRFGDQIDAVVSFDPVALGYLLGATGEVQMSTGDVLTEDNVVSLLLYEVYGRYTDFGQQDAFFAEAARGVFDLVKSGKGKSKDLLAAMGKAVAEGRLLVWSSVAEEQEVIETTDFSGILPLTNEPTTVVGVYFNDLTTAKINYFMDATVDVSAPVCSSGGFDTVATVTLTSRVPVDAATVLPAYVLGASENGEMYVETVVLGPIGAAYSTYDPGTGASLVNSGVDKGRPVARVSMLLLPGETKTISVTMASPAGKYGPLMVKTTPLVTPTALSQSEGSCT